MAKLVKTFSETSPPLGFTHATGAAAANVPRVRDIRHGSYDVNGWSASGQRRNSLAGLALTTSNGSAPRPASGRRSSRAGDTASRDGISPTEEPAAATGSGEKKIEAIVEESTAAGRTASGHTLDSSELAGLTPHDPRVPYPNGYQFPPPHSKWKSVQIGLTAFGKFAITPLGFFITIYGLNVVAWGGMLFLLLCGAAPAMCYPSCNDNNSARKIWLEIDAQILNALFCVTGFGLMPWRFRDLYFLMQFRLQKKESGIRRLAGIHNDWFRLQGSQEVPIDFNPKDGIPPEGVSESVLAFPISSSPDAPLTGERAPASAYWKMDFMIWCYAWNSLLQIALCGVMWGFNRFDRPGWATGLLIAVACIIAMAGGLISFKDGKNVKKVEGVPVSEEDMEILARAHDAEASGASNKE